MKVPQRFCGTRSQAQNRLTFFTTFLANSEDDKLMIVCSCCFFVDFFFVVVFLLFFFAVFFFISSEETKFEISCIGINLNEISNSIFGKKKSLEKYFKMSSAENFSQSAKRQSFPRYWRILSSADNLCKQFGPRSGPTKRRAWSGSTV